MTDVPPKKKPFEPSLNQAIREGRLEEFIRQAEKEGIGPADRAAFERVVGKAIKAPRSKDRT